MGIWKVDLTYSEAECRNRDIDLLKCRSFVVLHHFTDNQVLDPNFGQLIMEVVKAAKPLVYWCAFLVIYLLVYEWRSSDGTSMNDYMSVGDDEDEDDEDEDEDLDVEDGDEDQEEDEETDG